MMVVDVVLSYFCIFSKLSNGYFAGITLIPCHDYIEVTFDSFDKINDISANQYPFYLIKLCHISLLIVHFTLALIYYSYNILTLSSILN